MKPEMRQKLAREPFAEKLRKVAQLILLARTFPRRPRLTAAHPHGKCAAEQGVSEEEALKHAWKKSPRSSWKKLRGFTGRRESCTEYANPYCAQSN